MIHALEILNKYTDTGLREIKLFREILRVIKSQLTFLWFYEKFVLQNVPQ